MIDYKVLSLIISLCKHEIVKKKKIYFKKYKLFLNELLFNYISLLFTDVTKIHGI